MSTGNSSIVEKVNEYGARLTRVLEAELKPEDSFDMEALVRDGRVSLRIKFLVRNPDWKPSLRHLENETHRGSQNRRSNHG